MRTFDCFLFNNELDLLELRLHTLNNHVDRFVLCEAETTFSNLPKSLYFQKHKHEPRFKPFLHKIIHHVVSPDDMPKGNGRRLNWKREHAQRNSCMAALKNNGAQPDDLILISDLDEIPTPNAIKQFKPPTSLITAHFHLFFFNVFIGNSHAPPKTSPRYRLISDDWPATRMSLLKDVPSIRILKKIRPREYRAWMKPILRPITRRPPHIIHKGARHFFGVLNLHDLPYKYLAAYHAKVHQPIRRLAEQNASIQDFISHEGRRRQCDIIAEPLNDSYPPYLLQNQDKYKDLIYPVDKLTTLYKHPTTP